MARRYRLLPKQRLEAFSDGVLAIVITLLVFGLKVPTETDNLGAALLGQWRTYLAYLVSFAFVGGWWMAHANLTRFIRSANAAFFRLNLTALLFVSVTPFATSLLSAHSSDAGARVATVVFGLDIFLASVALSLLGTYLARRKDMIDDAVAADDLRAFVRTRWWVVGLLGAAVVVAGFSPALPSCSI